MNKLIRNAHVYKAVLPAAEQLYKHLQEQAFVELGPLDASRAGFVPVPQGFDLVEKFEGGFAFSVRIDSKILPGSVVRAKTAERIEKIEEARGYRVGRKEKAEIKERVITELLAVAFVKTAIVTCFYDVENQFLIVPTSSKQVAGMITGKLVKAVGSIKTETINVCDVKMGLTTRLSSFVAGGDDAFGGDFGLGGIAKLERADEVAEKINFDLGDISAAKESIAEALACGFSVASLGLTHGTAAFSLTHDFKFRSVSFGYDSEPSGDAYQDWKTDAYLQVREMAGLVKSLCDLMGYQAPEGEEAAA